MGSCIVFTLLIMGLSSLLFAGLTDDPVTVKANPYGFDLLLWCDIDDLGSTFLSRVEQGEFDAICISSAHFYSDNTLINCFTTTQIDNFRTQVLTVNPNMKFFADIYSWEYSPDLTTSQLRQDCIDEIDDWLDTFGNRFDGIIDDVEVWVGTDPDRWAYLEEASAQLESTIPYYGWVHYNWVNQTSCDRDAVGLYGTQNYYESEWKAGFDSVRDQAVTEGKTDYMICIMAKEYGDRPTVEDMLGFLEDKITENGEAYYSLMSYFGIWEYERLTSDDWNAWFSFFTEEAPTSSPPPYQAYESDWYMNETVIYIGDQVGYGVCGTQQTGSGTYVNMSQTGDCTVDFGWRIYLQYSTNSSVELTSGSPEAIVSRSSVGSGSQNNTFTIPYTPLVFGHTGVRFDLYVRFDSGSWVLIGRFVTDYLLNPSLQASTWTIKSYTSKEYSSGETNGLVYFGGTTYETSVWDVSLESSNQFDLMNYWLSQGNPFMFVVAPFTYLIGNVFYALLIFGVCMMQYIRSHNLGYLMLLIILMFAGSIGNFMLDSTLMAVIWLACAFGLAMLFWGVFR